MNREREQIDRFIDLLRLMALGLENGRLRLVPGWQSALAFDQQQLSHVLLDFEFEGGAAGFAQFIGGPSHGGSGGAIALCTAAGRVADAPHPTPPSGPSAAWAHEGNSAPANANVRGSQKSERSGERHSSEVNASSRSPAVANGA